MNKYKNDENKINVKIDNVKKYLNFLIKIIFQFNHFDVDLGFDDGAKKGIIVKDNVIFEIIDKDFCFDKKVLLLLMTLLQMLIMVISNRYRFFIHKDLCFDHRL